MSHTALIQSLRCIMSYSSVTLDMLNVAVEGSTISSVDRLAQYTPSPIYPRHTRKHHLDHIMTTNIFKNTRNCQSALGSDITV
jgi:hypothetical protein